VRNPVRTAIVGIGNCASSLVQGVEFYGGEAAGEDATGLMRQRIGPYTVSSLEFVAAFDVSSRKVGKDLADAIFEPPNETLVFAKVPQTGVEVLRGPVLDGLSTLYRSKVTESPGPPADVVAALRSARADVLISYLPVGSQQAAEFYAAAAIEAGCAFVNCMPASVAADPGWAQRFTAAGLPVIGDDIKSQVGATILHRVLTRLFEDRGVRLERSYQLNMGGNMDFLNMAEPDRARSKEISKVRSVNSQLSTQLPDDLLTAGLHYVPWLGDRKTASIRLEGAGFGRAPITVDVRLDVWDSPNSAGVAIDALRYARVALDRGIAGPVTEACAYLMKSPPVQFPDDVAKRNLDRFAQ